MKKKYNKTTENEKKNRNLKNNTNIYQILKMQIKE